MKRNKLIKIFGILFIIIGIVIVVVDAITIVVMPIPMDLALKVSENEIITYYERDPEVVAEIEKLYDKEDVIYIDGRSYCMVDSDGDGYCNGVVPSCYEGLDMLENTFMRCYDEFWRDFFYTVDSAVMKTDNAGKSTVEMIISGLKDDWDAVLVNVDFYDSEGVYLGQEYERISDIPENKKIRMYIDHRPDERGVAADYFRIYSVCAIKSDELFEFKLYE